MEPMQAAFLPSLQPGLIAIGLLKKIGLQGIEWQSFFNTLVSHSLVAFLGYFAFGGIKLFRRRAPEGGGRVTPRNYRAV